MSSLAREGRRGFLKRPRLAKNRELRLLSINNQALRNTVKRKDMKLQNSTGEILGRRKVYYVTIYDKDGKMVAFLGSELHYVSSRVDAALFDTAEEAEELMKKAESNGICNTIDNFAKMVVSHDTQYQTQVWKF